MVFRTDVCSIRLLKFLTGVLVSKVNIVNSLLGGTYRRFFILGVYLCAQVRRQGYIYANPSRSGGRSARGVVITTVYDQALNSFADQQYHRN